MLSFLVRPMKRTSQAHVNPLVLDNGRGSLYFHHPPKDATDTDPGYFMTATVPPREVKELPEKGSTVYPEQKSSTIIPPPHFHWRQAETFTVREGSFLGQVSGRQTIVTPTSSSTGAIKGDEPEGTIVIPAGAFHTFSNASATENLVVDVKLSPAGTSDGKQDERFFRNAYGALNDYVREKRPLSLPHVMLLLYSADTAVGLPGPEWLMRPIARFIT